MALAYCARFHILIQKNGQKNVLSAMGNSFQYLLSAVHYSDDTGGSNKNLSRAMKSHLERAIKYDQFLKDQLNEYEKGKEFLAVMMGNKNKKMTQEEVDEAIEYLFPSRLYVPKSRPLMKPPSEIFPPLKEAEFDYSGRPYHFMFYTTKKNFNQILHDAAKTLEALNLTEAKKKNPPEPLFMAGKMWLSHEELENMCKEKLSPSDYEKCIDVLNKLMEHPFASEAESFLKNFWKILESAKEDIILTPVDMEGGIQVVTIERACRKTSVAKVTISCPGTGRIQINNMKLDYFPDISCREQMDKVEYRAVTKFLVFDELTLKAIHPKLTKVYGNSALFMSTVKKLAAEFHRGRTSLEDDPREGRPKTATTTEIIEKLHDIALDNRRVKVNEIAESVRISQERLRNTVHK